MAKNGVVTVVNDLMVDLSPEAMQVTTGKGKKQVVDAEATAANISVNLSYYRGLLDAFDAVSDKIAGLDDATAEHKVAYDALYAYAEENHEDMIAALAEQGIESFGVGGGEEGDPFEYVAELELDDVKKIAKACGVKVMKKDTVESLVEKLSEEVEEDALAEQLTELGYYDSEEDEEDDAAADEGDEEAEDEEEVDESELDEILDEEFEDEVMEEEEKAAGKGKKNLPNKK